MPRYRVELTPAAQRDLKRVEVSVARRISQTLAALAEEPRPFGSRRLRESDLYRVRVGDYRIIYQTRDAILVVLIVRVRHRSEVYR